MLLALSTLACGRNLDFDLQIWSLPVAKHGQSPSVVANTGAKVGFWRGDIKGLVDDIGALKPTIFIGVPRVFDRIYSGVLAKIQVGVAGALASDCYCECTVPSEQAGHQKYMPSRAATDSSWPVRCPCAVAHWQARPPAVSAKVLDQQWRRSGGVMHMQEAGGLKKFLFDWGFKRKLHYIEGGYPQHAVSTHRHLVYDLP